MVAIAGLRGTGDWGTDERPKNFREMILWLQPNGVAPMFAMSSKMSSHPTDDPEFNWWEESLAVLRLSVDGALNTTATTLVLDSGGLDLVVGDLLLAEAPTETNAYADEILEVTAVASDTSITVTRGARDSTAASIADNSFVTLIGSIFAEGTSSPEATSRNPTKKNNYCQIFKTAYEQTKSAVVTHTRTGDSLKNDKKRRSFDHSRAIEFASIFGKAYEDTGANGKPKRSTGGLMEFLAAAGRVSVKSAAYTDINELFDDIFDVFDYTGDGATGGDERLSWVGNGALNAINKLAKVDGEIQFNEVVKQWGMNLRKLVTPQGTFMLRSHPLMNTHARYTNTMFIVDPSGLRYRHLRDTKPMENIQGNDEDTTKGQWLTEAGYEYNHMLTMKCISNITFAAP